MSGSVNKAIILGRVGKEPEVRTFGNGGKVANFSVATSERWTDKKSGEKKESTTWHNIAIFNEGLVSIVERYVKKGSKLYIEGAIKTRSWQDRDGNDRYTTEVVLQGYGGVLTLLDSRSDNSVGGQSYGDTSSPSRHDQQKQNGYQPDNSHELDDSIPF